MHSYNGIKIMEILQNICLENYVGLILVFCIFLYKQRKVLISAQVNYSFLSTLSP